MQSSASSSWLTERVHAQMHLSCSPLSKGIAIYKLNLEAQGIAGLEEHIFALVSAAICHL